MLEFAKFFQVLKLLFSFAYQVEVFRSKAQSAKEALERAFQMIYLISIKTWPPLWMKETHSM